MPTDRTHARKASVVYAEALLKAARVGKKTADVQRVSILALSEQLADVQTAVIGNIELRNTLADATISLKDRKQIAAKIFVGFDAVLIAVLGVIIERGDLMLLPRINEAYLYAAEAALGAVIIDVATVVALDDKLRAQLKSKYAASTGARIILREHIDPAIVGGIVLSSHGRRIDASVVSQLQNARTVLSRQ